jgi:branched-chain amino acid transport system ATP-binding protein
MRALATSNVTVAYRGLLALSDVSLGLEQGTITGLIGPNGAGKSTMIGVLSGLVRPSSGHVLLDGRDVTRLPPHRRAHLGMARTFQRLELWRSMSVEENIQTAAEFAPARGGRHGRDAKSAAREAIELLGLQDVAGKEVTELSSGHGRLVEVARGVARRPKVLLLDEPSAGLNESESRKLGETLARYVAVSGTSILLVEHHVELVSAICAYVYVLEFGQLIASGTATEVRASEAVQKAYLGRRHNVAGA